MAEHQKYRPTFIVSSGRCGSTLMSRLLALHPKVLSLSEFFMSLSSRVFIYPELDGEKLWRMLSRPSLSARRVFRPEFMRDEYLYPHDRGRYAPGDIPPILCTVLPQVSEHPDQLFDELEPVIRRRPKAPLAEQYSFLFNWLTQHLQKDLWVERSGASLLFLPQIRQAFPRARFVHLYRNGPDVAMSVAHHPPMRMFAHRWFQMRKIGIDLLRPPFVVGTSRAAAIMESVTVPLIDLEGDMRKPIDPVMAGEFYSALVTQGQTYLKDIPPSDLFQLNYDQMVDDPKPVLQNLLYFIGDDTERLMDAAWIDRASAIPRRRPSRVDDLPAETRKALLDVCVPGDRQLGLAPT